MDSVVDIKTNSQDSLDSQMSFQQNNSSTSSTLYPPQFISKNEQQTQAAKKVFLEDKNLLFVSKECYFLGEFQYDNITIIREYIQNKEFCNQKIYHTHLKQKYSANLSSQIIIAHGLYETSAHYMETAFVLVGLGYEVHLFDFSGFGHSGGKRMNSSCKELQSDFISVYDRLSHSRPIYIIACSISVPIILSCMILNPQTIKINGFISYSAMISIPLIYNKYNLASNAALFFLSKLNPSLYFNLKTNFSVLHRSNYQIKKDILLSDGQTNCITIGMAYDLISIQNFVLDNLLNVNVPLLILYGQEDQIVNQQDSITLYCKVGILDKTIKILKDQQHLFLLDSNKSEVFNIISQWLEIQSKHNANMINSKQDQIPFSHPLHQRQDFTSQIRAVSKKQTPQECNSGILSFYSKKSLSSISQDLSDEEFSQDEYDDEEQDGGQQSESESIKQMYKQQNKAKVNKQSKSLISNNSLRSTDSQNLSKQNEKYAVTQKHHHKQSPQKKKIKRVEEDCNICESSKILDYYNSSPMPSYSNPFDPQVKKANQDKITNEKLICKKNCKKPKYIYGTRLPNKNKFKLLVKCFLYILFFALLKLLTQNSNLFNLKAMKQILQKYLHQIALKSIKILNQIQ
ncbi:hypothetical protein ABPG73_007249 [Tetrahymena malaccensis]